MRKNKATCFAFGPTGSGKTHTMMGTRGEAGMCVRSASIRSRTHSGGLARTLALAHIHAPPAWVSAVRVLVKKMRSGRRCTALRANSAPVCGAAPVRYELVARDVFGTLHSAEFAPHRLTVHVSFFEIYSGEAYDLLNTRRHPPPPPPPSPIPRPRPGPRRSCASCQRSRAMPHATGRHAASATVARTALSRTSAARQRTGRRRLALREDQTGALNICGLTEQPVHQVGDMMRAIAVGTPAPHDRNSHTEGSTA